MNNSKPPRTKSIASTILLIVLAVAYLALKPKLEAWLGTPLPPIAGNAQPKQVEPQGPASSEPNRQRDATPKSVPTDAPTQADTSTAKPNSNRKENAKLGVLTADGRDFRSTAGLIYSPGSREGHRRKHVLKHAKDDQSKPVHGVFDDEATVFALVDEAYQKVKSRSDDVRTEQDGRRTSHVVKMRRRIGFKGGRNGKRAGNPPLDRIKLVLEGNEVITAFPY